MTVAAEDGNRSGLEREIKLRLDLEEAAHRLGAAGAEHCAGPYLERNWVLDRGGVLLAQGRLLRVRERIREDGASLGACITVKRALSGAPSVKERLEEEVEVASGAAALRTLGLLGYEVARSYEKVRTKYLLDGVVGGAHEVVLDQTPMGGFVEIEGPDPVATAATLGWSTDTLDVRNYLAIWDAEAPRGASPRDMLFVTAPAGFESCFPGEGA